VSAVTTRLPLKGVFAILLAGLVVGSIVTIVVVRSPSPPGTTQNGYRLSPSVHSSEGEVGDGFPVYRLYVLEASPEVNLTDVRMNLEQDGTTVASLANMTGCGGTANSPLLADYILEISYTDEIGCTLSAGDWVTVSLLHNGLGHNYTIRIGRVGGGDFVTGSVDVPLPPTASFDAPVTTNGTVEIALASVSQLYAPERFGGILPDLSGPPNYLFWGDLRFGVLSMSRYTTITLEDRDGDGMLSAGDTFSFSNMGSVTPGSYGFTLSWRDGGHLATATFP